MRNSKGVSLIALIITIIVIIILAAIVLSSGGDTTNRAQLAVFTNNFSQYADRVAMDALDAKQTLGIRSENVNDAQLNYMVANGLRKASGDSEVSDRTLPVGYIMPETIRKIYNIKSGEVVAYVIDDANITGYGKNNNKDGSAGYEFYGDSNGEEYHFVTSDGHVFTLPGFALPLEDGTIQFYISNEKGAYYVVKGNAKLQKGDTNLNGDTIDENVPILAYKKDFFGKLHGLTSSQEEVTQYGKKTGGHASTVKAQLTKEGRNTIIGGSTKNTGFDADISTNDLNNASQGLLTLSGS